MSHNNTTHNSNNNYSVEIIVDPDLSGGSGSVVKYSSSSNSPFYELKIIPPHTGVPVLAGNIRIDGIDSEWSYITNLHPYGSTSCTPHPTPHGISSQIAHTYMFGPGGTSCYATPQFNNGSYDFQGPYTFTNDAYVNGAFLTDSNPVTWSKIHLIEVYNNDSGGFDNDTLSPEIAENEKTWNTWNTSKSSITLSPYPAYLKAFVYVVYDPNIDIGHGNSLSLTLDIDEVAPVTGCMDPSAINGTYNPNATISDSTMCQYAIPEYSVSVSPLNPPPPVTATGPYTNIFLTSGYAIANGASNLYINVDGSNHYTTLTNTYQAGATVNELVVIDITPVVPNFGFGAFEAVYDFPVIANPPGTTGGPNANISLTAGHSQNPASWGDSKNNITGASIRLLNTGDTTVNGTITVNGEPEYQGDGNLSLWHNQLDPTGVQPTQTVYFGNNVQAVDPANPSTFITLNTSDIFIEEKYYPVGDPQMILNTGYEWFPYKLELKLQLDFVMPAHNVDIKLDIDHNTENQGDPNWVSPGGPPVYGCTDPNAFNYDPLATDDDGSCIPVILGCTDPSAFNYNSSANTDDGTCVPVIYGCTDPLADNYDSSANTDDGSCTYGGGGSGGGGGGGGGGFGGSGGGKIVCSMMNDFYGTPPTMNKVWLKHSANMKNAKVYALGYHTIFLPLVNFAKKEGKINYIVRKALEEIAINRTLDLQAEMEGTKRNTKGRIYRFLLEPLCYLVGWIKSN